MNLRNHFVVITQHSDRTDLGISHNSTNLFNETIISDNKANFTIQKPIYNADGPDTAYIYFRIRYTNSKKEEQGPFRGIFILTKEGIGQQLLDVREEQLKFIKPFLQKKGVW